MEGGLFQTLKILLQIPGWKAGTEFSEVWISISMCETHWSQIKFFSFAFNNLDCFLLSKGFRKWSCWMHENHQKSSKHRTLYFVSWSVKGTLYTVPYFVMFKLENKSIYVTNIWLKGIVFVVYVIAFVDLNSHKHVSVFHN